MGQGQADQVEPSSNNWGGERNPVCSPGIGEWGFELHAATGRLSMAEWGSYGAIFKTK